MNIKDNLVNIFKKYINEKIPQKQTNIFWQLFNGIEAGLTHLETLLRIHIRERNITSAQSVASLRTLAAQNGFEPQLKIPSRGTVVIECKQKIFNENGYPLYLQPYAVFKNKVTGMLYYMESEKTVKLTNNKVFVTLVEGELMTTTFKSNGLEIERFYIDNNNLANNSISIPGYTQVNSFIDNDLDKMFIVKFSSKPNSPIVVYVYGSEKDEVMNVTYRISFGASGNIDYNATFETDDIITTDGLDVSATDNEISIINVGNFHMGSNGSDINTLKSAIGFNHGINLLFDNTSYSNFVGKYSTLLLQKIVLSGSNKSINNIFVSKRLYLELPDSYISSLQSKKYIVNSDELKQLSSEISKNEFATSSHNVYNAEVNRFALQIKFSSIIDKQNYEKELSDLIYKQFMIFLYDKLHIVNLELLFADFMKENNIKFSYIVFNEQNENEKILTKKFIKTDYIIKHDEYLPILKGDFTIYGSERNFKLFTDINFIV